MSDRLVPSDNLASAGPEALSASPLRVERQGDRANGHPCSTGDPRMAEKPLRPFGVRGHIFNGNLPAVKASSELCHVVTSYLTLPDPLRKR